MSNSHAKTLGELKASGYQPQNIKDELRDNLIKKLKTGKPVFEGVLGYENTVFPEVERAILSRHSINFLGLRGQAKTRMARQLVGLLNKYIPIVEGSVIFDDPLQPISKFSKDLIGEKGDKTPVKWIHREERYTEKLATPDVTVADLIGDVDPIKAANLKLDYADERVIHFGLIPRSHRGIFVVNELPDLQPRIQVALFNILQEGDIQIRGFKLRLPLDVLFVFTANPEDYTNRGAIITPLKDRIQSQILTHYPKNIEISAAITKQEAKLTESQKMSVEVPDLVSNIIEQLAIEARNSEYVDQKSGVSARLTISAYENLVSAVERRILINGESSGRARIGDLLGIMPSITGKVELVYEGEQEGAKNVAINLMGKALRSTFPQFFPDPELAKRRKEEPNPYQNIINWFGKNDLELEAELTEKDFRKQISQVPDLEKLAKKYNPNAGEDDIFLLMEFILHGLSEYSMLSKNILEDGLSFSDLFNSVFSMDDYDDQ
ncbi:MAG: sigma 54-interacting transcriptional regulator [Flavobacteriales bacterium]|nr:sigma 54-interacting transcriptional regulator [Flavobacteriales bacterium]